MTKRFLALLLSSKSATNSAGLLDAEIDRQVFAILQFVAELGLLLRVVHSQRLGNVAADDSDLGKLGSGPSGDLSNTELNIWDSCKAKKK